MIEGKIIHEVIEGRQIIIYLPPDYEKESKPLPVVYVHDGKELEQLMDRVMQEIEEEFDKTGKSSFIVVGIYAKERIHEYTPWPAKALNPRFEDFKGQGEAYLDWITDKLMPYIDSNYKASQASSHKAIMGYSLGGLISVYAGFMRPCFAKIVSLSGSFWYEKMVDFVRAQELVNEEVQIYMSYGLKEGQGKKSLQAEVTKCSEIIRDILREKLDDKQLLEVYTDDGGHHDYRVVRYQNAFKWLSSQFK